jgi:RHS repeat-associated protein
LLTSSTATSYNLIYLLMQYIMLRRKLFILTACLSLFLAQRSNAQVTPPAAYSSTVKVNYINEWTATAPETNAGVLVTRPLKDVKLTTGYFDGLGRSLQTVTKQGSLVTDYNPIDVISPVVYDGYGREVYKYLPFAAKNINDNIALNDGLFKLNPFQQQAAFVSGQYSGETFFYGQTSYEPSPFNRETESFAPGNSWVGTAGNANENNRHSIKQKYWFNTVTDEVRIWNVTNVSNSLGAYNTPSGTDGIYPAGTLYKAVLVNETGNQVIEFKDKEGFVILKKVQLTASADDGTGSSHVGWLCTYYIYDDVNNLRCVIQPKGVTLLKNNNWDLTALNGAILSEQCFRYEYDKHNRMITKKVPGAGEVQMVYDARDRIVMTQDANMRKTDKMQWLITKYDDLQNRPIATYLIIDNNNYNNPDFHRGWASGSITYPAITDYPNELLTETHYDDYTGIPAGFYTATLYPGGYGPYLDAPASDYPDPLTIAASVKGLVTWTKVKVLGENKYITSCNLYDDKGRGVQVQSMNYTGAMDIFTNQYSFSGLLLRTHLKHQKGGGSGTQTYEVATKNTYDDLGRLRFVEKTVNNGGWKQIAEMKYDALGQLISKKLAPAYNSNAGLETLTYDYNIRGWMLGANRDYAKNPSATGKSFGFDLGYDKQAVGTIGNYATSQYNGNITGTVWKSKGDGQVRKYDFTYDAVNRLTGADFNQYASAFDKTAGIDFSLSNLTYDYNGNILTMDQKGLKVTGSSYVDQLRYTYQSNSNSNKLQNVVDISNDIQTRLGDFRYTDTHPQKATKDTYAQNPGSVDPATITDYNYDDNGNLDIDKNKGIISIIYNHLNLPKTIICGKGSIDYTYDAVGNKLKKTVHETGTSDKTTLYLFGTYEDDVLQFLPQEEGKIRPVRDANDNLTSFTYDYFLKDHLGNVRMVLTEEQKTDIYQAGMEDANRSFEVALFGDKVNTTATPKPGGFDSDGANAKVIVVNGTTAEGRVGPGVILKVMAGDKITAKANAWYQPTGMDNSANSGLNAIIENILGQLVPGVSAAAKGTAGAQVTNGILTPGMNSFLGTQTPESGAPKAYFNWVLLDEEQFKKVDASCGVVPVPVINAGQEKQLLQANNGSEIEMTKNGYLYVYVSNESKGNVYFDDIRVEHIRGSLLEETHYYPFGLTMSGISSKTLNSKYAENKRRFNSIDQTTDLDLNQYDAFYRNLDPQVGRWWQVDPKPNDILSPYSAMANNPISFGDPMGDTTWVYGRNGKYLGVVNDKLENQVHFLRDNGGNKPFDASKLSESDANKLAEGFRGRSMAFIGKNTINEAKELEKAATGSNKEIAFVGMIGKDKEIKLIAMNAGGNSTDASVEKMDQVVDNNYTKEQQANIFLIGHVHHGKLETPSATKPIELGRWFEGKDARFVSLGRPSPPGGAADNGDFGPYLYRNSTAAQRGQSAALIVTPYGFTIYGTASSSYLNSVSGKYSSTGHIQPGIESYHRYKQIKK